MNNIMLGVGQFFSFFFTGLRRCVFIFKRYFGVL